MTSPKQSPTRTKRAAPTNEIGYAVAYPGEYWTLDTTETTPELRWPYSTQVYEKMRRQDAQITSIMRAITLPVIRTGWRIDPNGARDEVVQHVADDLRLPILGLDEADKAPKKRNRGRFSWTEHVRLALLMCQYGHMFFEQVYRPSDDGKKWHLASLAPRMPRSISSMNVAANGDLVSISQYAMGTLTSGFAIAGGGSGKPIPASRLVGYVNDREGGDWIGTSVLRPAYKNWITKDALLRVQAQTIDRNGMGIPIYYAGPLDTQDDLEEGKRIASDYRSGDSSGAAVPNGAKLRLQGVEGALPDAMPAIRYHDEQMARAVLAHFLNLGTQTGSWALGSTFADFFVMSLQTLAQSIADTANQHIVEDLVDLNYGEDEPAPLIVFDEIGSRHDATAEAVALLLNAGAVFPDRKLEQALRIQYGLPPADPDDPEPTPDVPADAPPAPPIPTGEDPNDPEPQEADQ